MFELSKILIYKAVIHTFNRYSDTPEFSTHEIDHDEELTFEILKRNIEKLHASNEMKWASFKDNAPVGQLMEILDSDLNMFMETTRKIGSIIQDQLCRNAEALPSCNIAFVLFEMDEVMYFTALKFNHKDFLVKGVEATRDGGVAILQKSNDLYLTPKAKLDEGFIIHLKYLDIALLEKKYVIRGEKTELLSELILLANSSMSEKEKLTAFNTISKRIQDKFVGEDLQQRAAIKQAIADTIIETGKLDIGMALDLAYEDGNEIKGIYKEALKKAGLEKGEIKVEDAQARKFDSQKIVTDSGIELKIPVEYMNDSARVELTPNADGSIDITIKSVYDYKSI